MSALEQIKKLEAEKQKLIEQAKKEALQQVEAGLKQLSDLGFTYTLVEGTRSTTPRSPRRAGIRDSVLDAIKQAGTISRADLLTTLGATDDKAKQSISNAVAALKKSGAIHADQGNYSVTGEH